MRYSRALTSNAAAADDLLQDCLERALLRWHLWDPNRSLKTWLFTIMHNIYVDGYRSEKNTPLVAIDSDFVQSAQTSNDALNCKDLYNAVQELPREQKEVLILVGLEGVSYREVSEILSMPLGTVMSRLHRARKQLRQSLYADEPEKHGKAS